ncbi:tripartite tricarboxylate transporter TctB family protein [Knoellia locipacati]|uniref:tripartite tricarboxylate transporter TctB family protein n=1 Tax=Knoellia locipacati TaxID=882824 RepID=UPI00384CA63E
MTAHAYRLGAAVVLAIGAFAAYGAVRLTLGSLAAPGSGLWPFIVAVVALFCGLVLLAVDTPDDYERWTSHSRKVGLAFVALGVFIPLFQYLGFIVSGAALLFVWLRFLGRETWQRSLVLAVVGAVVVYVLFGQLLDVPFPSGLLARATGIEIGL